MGAEQWVAPQICETPECSVKGLDPQASYEFAVVAQNKYGKAEPEAVSIGGRDLRLVSRAAQY